MNPISFQSVRLLAFTDHDNPTVSQENGVLTLTATRKGEQIVITAPIAQTKVRTPKKQRSKENVVRGENHPKAKLNASDVIEMLEMFRDPSYRKEFDSEHKLLVNLAEIYKVHYTTVYKIVRGQSWGHLYHA